MTRKFRFIICILIKKKYTPTVIFDNAYNIIIKLIFKKIGTNLWTSDLYKFRLVKIYSNKL